MKNYLLTSIAIAASQFAVSNVFATTEVGDQTFTGRVVLSRPSFLSPGPAPAFKVANVAFSGTIQEQATVQEIVDVADPTKINGFIGTAVKPDQRVSNKIILAQMLDADLLPDDKVSGWSLRVVLPYNNLPSIEAVKKGQPTVRVPNQLFFLIFDWTSNLEGVATSAGLNGAASFTTSPTASGTFLALTAKSRVSGFSIVDAFYAPNYPDDNNYIEATGVGSFTETSKGFTTSVNVSGYGPNN